jgi:hypothetical protein
MEINLTMETLLVVMLVKTVLKLLPLALQVLRAQNASNAIFSLPQSQIRIPGGASLSLVVAIS